MHTALFYVDKFIAGEARAAFFAGNTFIFKISARAHHPVSLKSSLIFGPLGLPHRLHLLRDLRHVELEVNIDDTSAYAITRHRARVQHFVDIIKQHAQDKDRKSLLKRLHMRFSTDALTRYRQVEYMTWMHNSSSLLAAREWESATLKEKHMFVLEPLSELNGIEEMQLIGVPNWFKQCLEMRVRGEGGVLEDLVWPVKTIRRRQDQYKKARKVEVSTRKGSQPVFDWRAFAQRNGIALPEEAGRFFPVQGIVED